MIELLKTAAYEAGKAILEVYTSDSFEVELKDGVFPLTRADKAAHEIISHNLMETNIPVLSEEGRDIPYNERRHWKTFWMVDPLDGTKEFLKRNGEFTVNIALIEEGKPILGVVYAPVYDRLYIGGRDHRAIKIEKGVEYELPVSEKKPLSDHMASVGSRVVASRSHLNQETADFLDRMTEPIVVSMGSSLKFMTILDNEADVYPRFAPTMEWDTAAAHAVLNGLGFGIYHPGTTEQLTYNKEDLLNPYFISY